jgi:hypothetical protein
VWSELLISPANSYVILQLQLFHQLLPSKVGKFSFEYYPLVQEISSAIHYLLYFGGGLSLCLFTGISTLGVFFTLPPFSGAGCVPPTFSTVCVLLQFAVLF